MGVGLTSSNPTGLSASPFVLHAQGVMSANTNQQTCGHKLLSGAGVFFFAQLHVTVIDLDVRLPKNGGKKLLA